MINKNITKQKNNEEITTISVCTADDGDGANK